MERYRRELRAFVAGVLPGRESALVFGEGPKGARLMLVGEAPGEQETLLGRPFVGPAGKNLDRFLEIAGLRREEIYITNAVKLRPTKVGKSGRVSNRPPTREEIELFRPWLLREIERIAPGMIATLGNVPLRALLGAGKTIGQTHGQLLHPEGLPAPLTPLYHPASLIYNRSLEGVYEQDVLALARRLEKGQGAR